MKKASIIIFLVLLVDQVSKILVKTNMHLDESIPVFGTWFYIHFIENPGMAFGMEFGGETGKLLLSIFRIIAVCGIGWYLNKIIKEKVKPGLIISVSLIFAGALGNIIDSAFYGILFSESIGYSPQVAQFLPEEGGYAPFLHGKVVDMLYFPIINSRYPEWFPFVGGDHFQFFRPVFNIADSAITIGILMIIFNQKRYFEEEKNNSSKEPDVKDPEFLADPEG